jgi:hypothetical protein
MLKTLLYGMILPGILLIAGCQSGNEVLEQQNAQILSELRKLNQQLSGIQKKMQEEPALAFSSVKYPYNSTSARGANLALLSKVKKLPEKPTDDQIVKYIQQIIAATAGQNSYSMTDPQVGMYKLIGTGHVKVLLPFLDNNIFNASYYLKEAMPDLVEEKDKPLIKSSLIQYPNLLNTVVKKGWPREFKKEIFKLLESTTNSSPFHTLHMVVPSLAETPEDIQKLIDIYISNPVAAPLIQSLLVIPKINIHDIVNKAWDKSNTGSGYPQRYWKREKAIAAVRYGNNVSAAKYLLQQIIASDPNNPYESQTAITVLAGKSDFPVFDKNNLEKWYRKNADKISYDEKTGKFIISR